MVVLGRLRKKMGLLLNLFLDSSIIGGVYSASVGTRVFERNVEN